MQSSVSLANYTIGVADTFGATLPCAVQ